MTAMPASSIDPNLISVTPNQQGTTQPLRTSKPSRARKAPMKPKRARIVRRKKSGADRLRNCTIYKPRPLGRSKLTKAAPGCTSPPRSTLTVARALREIKYYQKYSEKLLLPKLPFLRVVKELTGQLDPVSEEHPMRWQSSAVACLQEMTEHVLVMYFELLYVLISWQS